MDLVPQRRGRVSGGDINNHDGRLGRVQLRSPARDGIVERRDGRLLERQGQDRVDHDLDARVLCPELLHDARVGVEDLGRLPVAEVDVVGAQHEVDHVGDVLVQPAGEVVAHNVDRLVARVALVPPVPVAVSRLAVLRVGRRRAYKVGPGGQPCADEVVPYSRPPAGDFGDTVAEWH